MTRTWQVILVAGLAVPLPGASAPGASLDTFSATYEIIGYNAAALSPDGNSLAVVLHSGAGHSANVIDVDGAAVVSSIQLDKEPRPSAPAQIEWLDSKRLLVQLGARLIVAIDADGKRSRPIVDWQKPEWHRPAAEGSRPILLSPTGGPATVPVILPESGARPAAARRVRVVGLPSDDLRFLHVEGVASGAYLGSDDDIAVYKVEIETGKLQAVHADTLTGTIIYDRQARPRIWYSAESRPGTYHHRAVEPKGAKWQPLAALVAEPDRSRLDLTAESWLGERTIPLAFDDNPQVLWVASNIGRDTYGLYAIDLATGRRTAQAIEHPSFDLAYPRAIGREAALVFDPARRTLVGVRYSGLGASTAWVDPDINGVQQILEKQMPAMGVHLVNWSSARDRFLVQLLSRTEPASYAIFHRSTGKLQRYLSRSPPDAKLPAVRTAPWAFKTAAGHPLSGTISVPVTPKITPTPLVVFLGSTEWARSSPAYAPDLTSLVRMGYAVMEVNHRGTLGFGRRHWDAARGDYAGMVGEDVIEAVDRLAREAGLAPRRVALFGEGFGGWLALQIAQRYPERTTCLVAINPILDFDAWAKNEHVTRRGLRFDDEVRRTYFGGTSDRRRASPLHQTTTVTRPLLIAARTFSAATANQDLAAYRKKQKAAGHEPEFFEMPKVDLRLQMPATFVVIESFLERHLARHPGE